MNIPNTFDDLAFINSLLFKEESHVLSKMAFNGIFRDKILVWIPGLLVPPPVQFMSSQT